MSPRPRLTRADRQDATIAAAASVFAVRGYHGATTDRIALAAGISQPYVVRMFGSKEELFLLVIQRSLNSILDAFREALAHTSGPPSEILGRAYRQLCKEHDVHLPLLHAFTLGANPVIGSAARRGFLRVATFLTDEAGMSIEDADEFLAHGMLINTLFGLRMSEDSDPLSVGLVERNCSP